MDTLTSEASRMSRQMTLPGIASAISLPGLAAGPLPCALLDGLTTDPYGRAPAPASRSVPPASSEEPTTSATCGRSSDASSRSAALQSSLASRLRARLEGIGSPLYALTWKEWAMESGPPICALRGSALRISDSDSGSLGWPTPTTRDWKDGGNPDVNVALNGLLGRVVWMAGWPTPVVNDETGSGYCYGAKREDGSRPKFLKLPGAAAIAGPMRYTADGMLLTGSTAGMASGGRLNPAHSRWLMGYPAAWDSCGATAMQSFQRSRRSSSER